MNDKIEFLALTKGFSALSTAERNMVLSEMSQEEFEQLKTVLQTARLMDADVLPSQGLKTRLQHKMAEQPKPVSTRPSLSAKVPVWAVAATLLLGVIAGWLLKPVSVQEKMVVKMQLHTDTVWQDKIMWRERVVVRERILYREKSISEPQAMLPEIEEPKVHEFDMAEPTFVAPRVGTSLGDTPELMRFFTQGGK